MKIHFSGAAGGVTGSKHLIEVSGKKVLLDCGMYQGKRKESAELNKKLPFDAAEIDAVVLSHAHIDHSGLLPLLNKNGFTGSIFCTPATKDILTPMLMDSAHIQEADARYYLKRKYRKNALHPIEPLYNKEDAEHTLHHLIAHKRGERFEVLPGIFCTFYNAGHVLGSAQVVLEGDGKKLAFTGDYGRKNRKIIRDPDPLPPVDAIISETTYGGRIHAPITETREDLGRIIRETAERGGKIIIPSFALERSQELLYDLHILYNEKKVPAIPVFVDSPLTTAFTHIFEKHIENFDEETHEYFLAKEKNPFSFSQVKHTKSVQESKDLNRFVGPCIILSASGMCEGGRIRHHLRNSIGDQKNTILFVGYQARNTLGRCILERRKMVKIFDEMHHVRAHIEVLNGYSGHGDQKDLLENIMQISGLQQIFLVHGDDDQRDEFANVLSEKGDWKIFQPMPGESHEV